MRLNEFRVRRNWLGQAVLQQRINSPSLIAGHVDSAVRSLYWVDVQYNQAPALLTEKKESP